MILEARAANCCSSTFVLKVDDRPVGKFEGRWFSESLDISLTGRRRLQCGPRLGGGQVIRG